MILDAGILISIDRGDRSAKVFVNAAVGQEWPLVTTEPVIAQVWRHGARQARLAAFLNSISTEPLRDGRAVGALLALSGTSDPVDAHLVAVAVRLRQPILTSDIGDITRLCNPLGDMAPKIMEWPREVS